MTNQQEQMLKEQFIEQAFSKVWVEKLKSGSFKDEELIRYCLDKAWPDAIIYVRKKNRPEDIEILKNAASVKNMIFDCIVNYSCKQDFDKWHDDICQKQNFGMRYGVWQKYINMCFKYLYCINESLNKSLCVDFTKCHIPLDDNTLLWCRNNSITQVSAWNGMTRGDYIQIRDGIKKILKNNPDLSGALQLDFIVWRIKKICDVLLNIKNLREDLKGLDNYQSWFANCGYDITDTKKVKAVIDEMELLKTYMQKE